MPLFKKTKAQTLTQLKTLKKNEAAQLDAVLQLMQTASASEKNLAVMLLKSYPAETIFRFAENSTIFHELCTKNSTLEQHWKNILKQKNYFTDEIKSVDNQITLSVFTQLKGAVVLAEFQKHTHQQNDAALSLLDEACNLGMYHALLQRLKLNVEIFKNKFNNNDEPQQTKVYLHALLKDAAAIGNLYWSVGYIDAANLLLDLAGTLAKTKNEAASLELFVPKKPLNWSWSNKYHHPDCPFSLVIVEAGIEALYKAKLFENSPLSAKLTKTIYPEGLLLDMEKNFKDWAGAYRYYLSFLEKELKLPLPESFCREAEAEVSKLSPPS